MINISRFRYWINSNFQESILFQLHIQEENGSSNLEYTSGRASTHQFKLVIPIKIKYIIANNLYHHHPVTYTWNENQFWDRINYNSFNNIWIEDQQIFNWRSRRN